jgi:hypothetical protein
MKTLLNIISISTALLCSNALAQGADFDPTSWKKNITGKPTQVLVLGSPHLSSLKDNFKPHMMSAVLDKLAQYKPDIITIEAVSGEQCEFLKRYASIYSGIHGNYCWDTDIVEKSTGLTVAAALGKINDTLSEWPKQPSAAQRRQLITYFLAANDRMSAQVQWQTLDEKERIMADGIDAELFKILRREKAGPNENYDVAVKLAVRLGLQRVFATDDHTADNIQILAGPEFGKALQDLWSKIESPISDEGDKLKKELATAEDMLNFYRFNNRFSTLKDFIQSDFGGALKQQTPQLLGRQYVAWWETRNLRMVANIRTAFGNHPGSKVLSIVGSSHKPYFDAYLHMMHEVELVNAVDVLK